MEMPLIRNFVIVSENGDCNGNRNASRRANEETFVRCVTCKCQTNKDVPIFSWKQNQRGSWTFGPMVNIKRKIRSVQKYLTDRIINDARRDKHSGVDRRIGLRKIMEVRLYETRGNRCDLKFET